MTPEELNEINRCADTIAQILYTDTDPETLQTLGDIEITVRQKMLQYVSPRVGIFLSKPVQASNLDELAP